MKRRLGNWGTYGELIALIVTVLLIIVLRLRASGGSSAPTSTPPVRLLVGVMTTWDKIERRHLIRQLYPLSLKNTTGTHPVIGKDVVRTIFVIGDAPDDTAKSILEWESEAYGDMMILEGVHENMNAGKTYQFFKALHDWGILYQDGGWTHVAKADDDTWYSQFAMSADQGTGSFFQTFWRHCINCILTIKSITVVKWS